jgi:caffeoyl-CoA O-methyltransferase
MSDPKSYAASDPAVEPYVRELLDPEDEVLADVRARSAAAGLPDIAVGPLDGRHLEVIARAIGATRIVEIGTLGGYSTVCLARALPATGVLHTFELEPAHAEVARESVRRAGLEAVVHIHVGEALARLAGIESEGPFDLVFIDADKERYPDYLAWAELHLRVGGTVLADNVFRKPRGGSCGETVHAFNERLARSGRWRATLLPIEDGLAMAVRLA